MADCWDWADVAAVGVMARSYGEHLGSPAEEEVFNVCMDCQGIEGRAMLYMTARGIRYAWEQAEGLIEELECERENAESALELQTRATGEALARVTQLEVELLKERKAHGA